MMRDELNDEDGEGGDRPKRSRRRGRRGGRRQRSLRQIARRDWRRGGWISPASDTPAETPCVEASLH